MTYDAIRAPTVEDQSKSIIVACIAANRSDDNPKLPDTKPIAPPAQPPRAIVQSGFNEVRSRSARNLAPRTSQKSL